MRHSIRSLFLLLVVLVIVVREIEAATTKPTAKGTTLLITKLTTKPTTRPTTKPTTKPTIKPTTRPIAEPTAKQTTKPTTEPITKSTTKPTTEPTTKPTTKPDTESTAKPTTIPTITTKPTTTSTTNTTTVTLTITTSTTTAAATAPKGVARNCQRYEDKLCDLACTKKCLGPSDAIGYFWGTTGHCDESGMCYCDSYTNPPHEATAPTISTSQCTKICSQGCSQSFAQADGLRGYCDEFGKCHCGAPATKKCVPIPRPVKPPVSCPSNGNRVTDAHRKAMVALHNALRSNLTKGLQKNMNGTFNPSGRNMYKLEWDCQMELDAQSWANQCNYSHTPDDDRLGQGENLYVYRHMNVLFPIDIQFNFLNAANLWWNEVVSGWMDKADSIFPWSPAYVIEHYTQMAWGKTYKIGCGISTCSFPMWAADPYAGMMCNGKPCEHPYWNNTAAYVVCRYTDHGNYFNEPVYEMGKPCSDCNAACTTAQPSTCDTTTGLCVIN